MKSWKSVLFLLVVIIAVNAVLYKAFTAYRYSWIVIHHTASPSDNYASITHYHQKKHRWRDAGYHLILSNGSMDVPLGHLEATGRYTHLSYALATRSPRHNLLDLHLCIVGNYEQRTLPEDLQRALANVLVRLQERYHIPNDHILFHRDVGATLCPGKFITKEKVRSWLDEANTCSDELKKQQEEAIGKAGFSVHTLPASFIILASLVTLKMVLIWLVVNALRRNKVSRTALDG